MENPEIASVNPHYTAEDLAKLLQCTIQHIRNMDRQGQIPGKIKFGRLVRFSRSQIDAWLNQTDSKS